MALFSNLRLKLLAIAFALAMWGGVAYAENPTTRSTYNLSIDRPNTPAGLVIVGSLPIIQVAVVGSAQTMRSFDQRNLTLTASFADVHVGANRIPIRVTSSDPTVTVEQPNPIIVQVDQVGSADVQVTVQRLHQLPSGFHEVSATVTPNHVTIHGPQSQLSGVQAVVQVDLAEQQGIISQNFVVQVLDPAGKKVDKGLSDPTSVSVRIDIQPDSVTETKAAGAAVTGQPATGYYISNIQVSPTTVNATGLADVLGALKQIASDPVDISNQNADVVKTVTLRPPAGVTVAPRTVQVHVFIAKNPLTSPPPAA